MGVVVVVVVAGAGIVDRRGVVGKHLGSCWEGRSMLVMEVAALVERSILLSRLEARILILLGDCGSDVVVMMMTMVNAGVVSLCVACLFLFLSPRLVSCFCFCSSLGFCFRFYPSSFARSDSSVSLFHEAVRQQHLPTLSSSFAPCQTVFAAHTRSLFHSHTADSLGNPVLSLLSTPQYAAGVFLLRVCARPPRGVLGPIPLEYGLPLLYDGCASDRGIRLRLPLASLPSLSSSSLVTGLLELPGSVGFGV